MSSAIQDPPAPRHGLQGSSVERMNPLDDNVAAAAAEDTTTKSSSVEPTNGLEVVPSTPIGILKQEVAAAASTITNNGHNNANNHGSPSSYARLQASNQLAAAASAASAAGVVSTGTTPPPKGNHENGGVASSNKQPTAPTLRVRKPSPATTTTPTANTLVASHPEPSTETSIRKKAKTSKKKAPKERAKAKDKPGTAMSIPGYNQEDVLLARATMGHPGNIVYRGKMAELLPLFKELGPDELARQLIDFIEQEIGGRFLERDDNNGWFDSTERKVHKVTRAIREAHVRHAGSVVRKRPSSPVVVATSLGGRAAKLKAKVGITETEKILDLRPDGRPKTVRKKKRKAEEDGGGAVEPSEPKQPRIEYQKPPKEPPKEFVYEEDPNEFYVEETAHKYHDPPLPNNPKYLNWVSPSELRPIPPPPPLPSFPNTGFCSWKFEEENRVLMADFSHCEGPIRTADSKFLFEMQERDDITVICRGLLDPVSLDTQFWDLEYIREARGDEFFHKFRRFDRMLDENGFEVYNELDHLCSMRIKDFVKYCGMREGFLKEKQSDPNAVEPTFTFEDHKFVEHSIGVWVSALYMIDLDIGRLFPDLYDNFMESFKLKAVLPGGENCMMKKVTQSARPFMGPNMYITPPASFTHFHQDGHGTVDSGHLCINGYNEIVILRRLTERHKKHALWILSGSKDNSTFWDGLYKEPHGDGLGPKPKWVTKDMIAECKRMGYCPSVLTLQPGDLIHINKGRLHAFRKLSSAKLPSTDCHAEQRAAVVEKNGLGSKEEMCISVAWDWMNRGVTPSGISRESLTILEGTILNKKNLVTSLAIPELSLFQIAAFVRAESTERPGSFLSRLGKKEQEHLLYKSPAQCICQGILPGLKYLADEHSDALKDGPNDSLEKGERLSIAKIPDTRENPAECPLDPYGNTDFDCKLCRRELSNVYYHCDGCEKLLNKDFNICQDCYKQKEFMHTIQMHPSNPKKKATLNHTGNMSYDRQSKCPCKNGPRCDFCGYCVGCSCRCHSWFTVHTRLFPLEQELQLVKQVKDLALGKEEGAPCVSETQLEEQVDLAMDRLKHAKEG